MHVALVLYELGLLLKSSGQSAQLCKDDQSDVVEEVSGEKKPQSLVFKNSVLPSLQ